jgi:uncharacterized protein (TIGR00369 family)
MTGTVATPPEGFRVHGHEGGFVDRNGPIYVADRPGGETVMLMATPAHLNGAGIVSGGMVMLLLDIAMGIAISAHCGGPHIHCPTIQLNTNFIEAARADTPLIGRAEIQRVTRSVAFLTAEIYCGDVCVASGSGVYRISSKVAAALFPSDRKPS